MTQFIVYLRAQSCKRPTLALRPGVQEAAVAAYIDRVGGAVLGRYTEQEVARPARDPRPQLDQAMAAAKATGATLLIGHIGRMARVPRFLARLRAAGIEVAAVDVAHLSRLTLPMLETLARQESTTHAGRISAGLAAAKARGQRIGSAHPEVAAKAAGAQRRAALLARARGLAPVLAEINAQGITTLRDICAELDRRGVPTPAGARQWGPVAVKRMLDRLGPA
jgi:DNA invertase Pin-like site-specific DNA recombinase